MISNAAVNYGTTSDYSNYGLFSGENLIPLKMTLFKGVIKGKMTHMTMEMLFENIEDDSIEAVYTFPVSDGAIFLGLELEINNDVYQTVIMEKSEAKESYEETVTDGDAAIIVTEVSDNLYAMEIGNIPPQTEVRIRYEYSVLHEWKDGLLRWRLPTVLAPRYGQSGLEQHYEPESSLLVKHEHTFHLSVEGSLANCDCSSPSHNMLIANNNGSKKIALNNEIALLNRDIILLFKDSINSQPVADVIWDKDLNDQYCALLSLNLPPVKTNKAAPKIIKVLIDCSGSMTGESITQARIAIREMINLMNSNDKVMIWKFGSKIEKLHNKPIAVSELDHNIFHQIEADLGGTELFDAVTKIAKKDFFSKELEADIFLITDGEVWGNDTSYNKVFKELGNTQRIFSVGVGRAVSTDVLNKLSIESNGAVELVTPDENMAERITTHFKRMYAPKVSRLDVSWSSEPSLTIEPPVIFSGDSAFISARFEKCPVGNININVQYYNGERGQWLCQYDETSFTDASEPLNVLSRTIAANLLTKSHEYSELKLALDYQLMTDKTACFAQIKLEEQQQSNGMPNLRKVPDMLADGYAGISMKRESLVLEDCLSYELSSSSLDSYDIPAFKRVNRNDLKDEIELIGFVENIDFNDVLRKLNAFYMMYSRTPANEEDLKICGYHPEEINYILSSNTSALNEAQLIAKVLLDLIKSESNTIPRDLIRLLRIQAKS